MNVKSGSSFVQNIHKMKYGQSGISKFEDIGQSYISEWKSLVQTSYAFLFVPLLAW